LNTYLTDRVMQSGKEYRFSREEQSDQFGTFDLITAAKLKIIQS